MPSPRVFKQESVPLFLSFNSLRVKVPKNKDRALTEVFTLEEKILVDAELTAKVDEVARVFTRKEAALRRALPAAHSSLRYGLPTTR